MDQTIFAFATPEGRSALAVLRISGDMCRNIIGRMMAKQPEPRSASLTKLRDPVSREVLDQAIVLWHPGPASFTGEDCLEFHIHGGNAVRRAVVRALGKMDHCRLAEPGEFTLRAFLNGKTDLSRLEGLADLLEAETDTQRRQAFAQLEGAAAAKCETWRQSLLNVMALLEVTIDFSDEGDAPVEVMVEVKARLTSLLDNFESELRYARSGEIIRDGFKVVIAGPPNAGKSSLLNALARRDVAIVTEVAGTTRDILEVPLDLGGMLVRVFDTAGLRPTDDPVERIGVERARQASANADLLLWLKPLGTGEICSFSGVEHAPSVLEVNTKKDLCEEDITHNINDIWISSSSGEGIADLLGTIEREAKLSCHREEGSLIVQERQKLCLKDGVESLARAILSIESSGGPELICEEIRVASAALDRLTGRIGSEDVLGAIFSRFCMGK